MFADLQFLKMFFWGLCFPEELLAPEWMLHFTSMTQKFRRTAEEFKVQYEAATAEDKIKNWEPMSYGLRTLIQERIPETREMCRLLLHSGSKCESHCKLKLSSSEYGQETLDFMWLIDRNLDALNIFACQFDLILTRQIAMIRQRISLFRELLRVLNNWPHISMRTVELIYHVHTWASNISHLAFLAWANCLATAKELFVMIWESTNRDPRIIALSLDVFNTPKSLKCQSTRSPRLLPDYIDFLLELVVSNFLNDQIDIDLEAIQEGMMFLLSFVTDSSNEELKLTELVLAEINAIISEVPSIICAPHRDNLYNLLFKIDGFKAKLRELYCVNTPISSYFDSPRANPTGFLDSLLDTIQKMLQGGVDFIPSVKNQIIGVHEELTSLRPFVLQYDFELPNEEDNRLIDIKIQIVSMIHYAAYITNLCPSTSLSIWYGIMCLPNIMHRIKLLNYEVEKIKDDHMHTNKKVTDEIESTEALPPRATTSKHEGAFIGFKDSVESILDRLQGGRKDLTIISISGMPGQGKTTLARRIYDDPSIQYYFHKFAWGSATKECKMRNLFADLLHNDTEREDYGNLDIHDLADLVRKSLKGRRYLIVLDDIWDVDVWWQVQYSFPDDRNGSRILFTSRNDNLASQCKPNSISHRLPLFSDHESWELMQDKLLCSVGLSEELVTVAKQIAVYCRGLPLAVVLIASHLKRISPELNLWMEVAENLKSHLASEGCMHILELSYKYLPQHLKPCFLYFGSAFRRGENIHAGKLIRLWIAEGFIKGNEIICSKDLAREYLEYLVSQNLIQVSRRGSMGNIKYLTVHELLYDLCIQKSNLLRLADYRTIEDESYESVSRKYNYRRRWVCFRDMDPAFIHLTSHSVQKELLPWSQVHSLFWSYPDIIRIQCKPLSSFFNNFRVLTVLDMMDVILEGSAFHLAILFLSNIHLRYLGLRASLSGVKLSIGKWWNLETLIMISDPVILCLPKSLWEIKSLRYISVELCDVDFNGFKQNVSTTASACNVESLGGIFVGDDVKTHEFLRSLPKLRKLKCYYEGNSPKFFCMFESLEKLESLRIVRYEKVIPRGFLFPNHGFGLPDTLKKLCLQGSGLPWRAMSTIGNLPHLEVLKLHENAYKGPTWNLGDGEFSKLKYLRLLGSNVEQIDDSDCDSPPFPCLEKLELFSCGTLENVPISFGDICTLKNIHLCASPKALGSIVAICEQQREMGNQDLQLVVRDHPSLVLDDKKKKLRRMLGRRQKCSSYSGH